jgi:5'(3')-deoxyribonucleotidase
VRLGIDLDGVVADFNAGWIDRYQAEFGTSVPLDAVTTWDGIPALTHFPDMERFWEWARGEDAGSLFRHLDPYPGALGALAALDRAGHDIVVLTTKPGWAVHDTFAWIADHRIPTREVHVIERKWRVPCDVYLDDAPHVLTGLHRNRPEAAVCRFVRPWNRPMPGVHDVAEWDAFTALVDALTAGSAEAGPGSG